MGLLESKDNKISSFQESYIKQTRTDHPYFGSHILLINRNQKEMLIHKQIRLRSADEYREFQEKYDEINRKPFSIIYPKMMVKGSAFETCTSVYEIVGRPLFQIINTEGCLSEGKAWFLLNQISKALEVLSESNRAHWSISPQTIYQNCHKNYLIYDSLFVLGFDPQSFLLRKMDNHQLLSEKTEKLLRRGAIVSQMEGFEEDCYCLGFVMLFALTGVHSSRLPSHAGQKSQAVRDILYERRGSISQEMTEIIMELTNNDAIRRMDNYKLRRHLKEKEAEIIHNEDKQFRKPIKRNKQIVSTPQQRLSHPLSTNQSLPSPYLNQPINQHQFSTIPPPHPSNRFQVHYQIPFLARNQQSSLCRASYADIYRQSSPCFPQGNHQIAHFVDHPSDRSQTLARINSYDQLLRKN